MDRITRLLSAQKSPPPAQVVKETTKVPSTSRDFATDEYRYDVGSTGYNVTTTIMANNGYYPNDRPANLGSETDYTNDPAAGGFFASDFRKHDDLKNMLDGNKDGLKLEAMKRIIGMVAKGKDASNLFPAVVKNVVSKNIEVKKLVYVYLVRYAEEQQDLALLSISTFQRALKDPNQLIRASALRVLSSIRVPVIVPIMMLAIKDAANDMSPYVRKTAAHAIPKLFSLDPDQRDQLMDVIEKLLSDKTTLVVGSAVMAFEEVCPERIDLIHKNYRKLCNLLVDVEEWGQVVIIHMLTRYSRMQFVDPNKADHIADGDGKFYDSEGSENKESSEKVFIMDSDHRLLLRNCKPLLQSRNAAVVMSVAQLYYYIAPKNEINLIAKALIRLLHSHREIQSVVLSNIATVSTKGRGIFEPYMKNFFVRSSDPTHIKLLKLEVLTNLATEMNIPIILREFQTYVSSLDPEFVAATIQAIGRCASAISEVTDTCLNGLVSLLSNRNETVVAESVVVIKKLLQMQPSAHKDIIIHMTRLVDTITVPMAKASILWLLGEYADRVTKIAPDVLRKVAKSFVNEEEIVKLQTLNLAAKLCLTNPKQTKLLAQYVFSLAKYDQNYDIRDRARFLRQLVMPQGETASAFSKYGKKILLAPKPAPVLQSNFKDRDHFQLGSLSHFINSRATDYKELPPFPEVAPDPSVRNVEIAVTWQDSRSLKKKKQQLIKKSSFYTDSSSPVNSSGESFSSSDSEDDAVKSDSDKETSGVTESDESSTETDTDEESSESSDSIKEKPRSSQKKRSSSIESSSASEASSEEDESDSTNDDNGNKKAPPPAQGNLDLLLDLDNNSSTAPVMIASTAPIASVTQETRKIDSGVLTSHVSCPAYIVHKQHELLNKYSGSGLKVTYRFTRSINIFSPKMTTIELTITNERTDAVKDIHVPDKKTGSVEVKGFPSLGVLGVNCTITATIGIDYAESTHQASFELKSENQSFNLTINAVVGEMLTPILMTEDLFIKQQTRLKGMNENVTTFDLLPENEDEKTLTAKVQETANVAQVTCVSTEPDLTLRFAGQTLCSGSVVLVTIVRQKNGKVKIFVNCEKIVIGSVMFKELKDAFSTLCLKKG